MPEACVVLRKWWKKRHATLKPPLRRSGGKEIRNGCGIIEERGENSETNAANSAQAAAASQTASETPRQQPKNQKPTRKIARQPKDERNQRKVQPDGSENQRNDAKASETAAKNSQNAAAESEMRQLVLRLQQLDQQLLRLTAESSEDERN